MTATILSITRVIVLDEAENFTTNKL